ncbi:ABC transporter substrate-binding protein [Fusibacter ferrireducens]|uniref:Carbohydrate ABC transporter substrate-binding protein n=1 Tax=Fusibacter ferrireducens TaxID=2785058 RepID=A0ABR9ZN70_9FIRM|nr:ABC transporter substrate-binding protein [Fusibacter ferrireducens]MBF4691907.1 carbohydrate ABC transporter substrate-binding protein [Fusibacter ferrireducens]
MKKCILLFFIVILGLFTTSCGQSNALGTSENAPSENAISQATSEKDPLESLLTEDLSGELTVSCYDTMFYKDTMEKAAKAFEAKNPGTKIHVETFASMPVMKTLENGITVSTRDNEEQERADYIQKINTELMSGQGADLLAMDVLPYNKYTDANLLEDLQLYMDQDKDFDISNYRENIIHALKYNNGQYIMPLDYMFDYVAYDKSLFTEEEQEKLKSRGKYTYNQLFEDGLLPFNRAKANTNQPIKMFHTTAGPQTFNALFNMDYESYIDIENKKINLTDGRFAKLLESVKAYGDKAYLNPDSESGEFTLEDFEKIRSEQFFYKVKSSFSLLEDVTRKFELEPSRSANILVGDDTHDEVLGLLSNADGKVNFRYTQAFSINSNSKNKALAWAFLKFIISDANQSDQTMFLGGLPINNHARSERAKLETLDMIQKEDAESKEKSQKVYDYYVNTIEAFSNALNNAPVKDDHIDMIISNEIVDFFSGNKTSDEVANILQNKIELYLNE